MPRWAESAPLPHQIHHELIGNRAGAIVQVDLVHMRTVITIAVVVDGTDEATVDRCKGRAERLLIEANRT